MEGLTGALARITELQGKLSTLRPPAPAGGFDALLRQAPASPARTALAADSLADAAPAGLAPRAERTGALSGGRVPAGRVSAALLSSDTWLSTQRPPSLVAPRAAPGPAQPVVAQVDARATPAVAATYPNGQIPASALVPVGGGERLRADAAAGFLELRAAAARDGVDLPVNDSYRSLAEQQDVARRKGLYSEGGLAARPGTSTHGLGLSVDLQLNSRALAWMRRNGERHGFVEDVPREPWHWTYAPGKA